MQYQRQFRYSWVIVIFSAWAPWHRVLEKLRHGLQYFALHNVKTYRSYYSGVTWALCRLKSQAIGLFGWQLIRANNKAPHRWFFLPSQRAGNADSSHIMTSGCASLQWCHNGRDGVSNHQPHHCLLNWLFRRRSKNISKLYATGNIPALVQIMAWRRPGDKPLSEPMMVSLLTHICVTRPQWVKD